ncbi:MAG TPA: hypothetical protein ENJ53_10205 [Phaeodactylibacter sp.]|nr:hypothetical protein [Phaeodactylibacter sp.]
MFFCIKLKSSNLEIQNSFKRKTSRYNQRSATISGAKRSATISGAKRSATISGVKRSATISGVKRSVTISAALQSAKRQFKNRPKDFMSC